jgi:hypothetical protein
MTWGTVGNVSTANLDAGSDSPAAARPDLKAALDELKNVINGRATANGVAPLNASTKVDATYLPDEINSSSANNLTLDPDTNVVVVEDIIKLNPRTNAQLSAQAGLANGMVAFMSDGDSTAGIPVYYSDGHWRRFTDNSQI